MPARFVSLNASLLMLVVTGTSALAAERGAPSGRRAPAGAHAIRTEVARKAPDASRRAALMHTAARLLQVLADQQGQGAARRGPALGAGRSVGAPPSLGSVVHALAAGVDEPPPPPPARRERRPTRREPPDGRRPAVELRVFDLAHARAPTVGKQLFELFDRNELPHVAADERTNTLIVRVRPELLEQVETVIATLDRPGGAEEGPRRPAAAVIVVRHADARDLHTLLDRLMGGWEPWEAMVRAAVDERRNALVLIGPGPAIDLAREIVEQLDAVSEPRAAEPPRRPHTDRDRGERPRRPQRQRRPAPPESPRPAPEPRAATPPGR